MRVFSHRRVRLIDWGLGLWDYYDTSYRTVFVGLVWHAKFALISDQTEHYKLPKPHPNQARPSLITSLKKTGYQSTYFLPEYYLIFYKEPPYL